MISFDDDNDLVLLLGLENRKDTGKAVWNFFGGKRERSYEDYPLLTAMREMAEETNGVINEEITNIVLAHSLPKVWYAVVLF